MFYKDLFQVTLPIVNQKKLLKFPIKLPSIEQQKVIAIFLNELEKIEHIEQTDEITANSDLKKLAKRFYTIELNSSAFSLECTHQQIYLKKLRQAILQEAIEGQLTADWRVNNPVCLGDPNTDAQALLATIKAEKQALIADGKIKKEKPLAPINPDNVPFGLPDGWVFKMFNEGI